MRCCGRTRGPAAKRGPHACHPESAIFWRARDLSVRLAGERILDVESAAFVSLCGQRKTQERIAHSPETGKPCRTNRPLRNWVSEINLLAMALIE